MIICEALGKAVVRMKRDSVLDDFTCLRRSSPSKGWRLRSAMMIWTGAMARMRCLAVQAMIRCRVATIAIALTGAMAMMAVMVM